jgi:hypothetical protein
MRWQLPKPHEQAGADYHQTFIPRSEINALGNGRRGCRCRHGRICKAAEARTLEPPSHATTPLGAPSGPRANAEAHAALPLPRNTCRTPWSNSPDTISAKELAELQIVVNSSRSIANYSFSSARFLSRFLAISDLINRGQIDLTVRRRKPVLTDCPGNSRMFVNTSSIAASWTRKRTTPIN